MADQPTIELWRNIGLGLLIACPSGVRYTAQAGGNACRHPDIEGVYVPLSERWPDPQEAALDALFTGPKWRGWCDNGLDEASADVIDAILAMAPQTDYLRVDRTRLHESMEAWIHVHWSGPDPGAAPGLSGGYDFHGFKSSSGVLVWENSD